MQPGVPSETDPTRTGVRPFRTSPAALTLALLFLLLMLMFAAYFHPMEEVTSAERDGYVGYTRQLAEGHLPRDPFRPLLYPLLAAATTAVTGDAFTAGRTVSVFAAALFCLCAYWMGRLVLRSEAGGLIAMAGMMLNHNVVRHGVHVSTDMTFAALSALTVVVALAMAESGSRRWIVVAGVAWGLSYFTRYTALATLPVVAAAIALQPKASLRARGVDVLTFAAVAAVVLLPHFVITNRLFGDPFHNENWRNLALKLYGDWDWSYLKDNPFDGLLEVVMHSPGTWLKSSARELATFGGRTLVNLGGYGATGVVFALLSLTGAVLMLRRITRPAFLLVLAVVSFVIFVCLFFYTSPRFMLPVLPALYVCCARALRSTPLQRPLGVGRRPLAGGVAAAVFLALGAWALVREVPVFVSLHPVAEARAAEDLQRRYGEDIRVLGSSPFLGRRVGYRYRQVRVTAEDTGFYDALARLAAVERPDYLIVGRLTGGGVPPELLDGRPPPFLSVVEASPEVVVYRFVPGGGGGRHGP